MAFQQGLSGLYAASKALDVTSNNVANSATVGFKSAAAHFADVYANSLAGSGASAVGIGTSVGAVQQQFTQGNITTTNNPLDISINGGGFYRMSTNGTITYSRSGQFHLDKDGFVIDDQSRRLTGYPVVEGTVVTSSPTDLQLSSANISPVATGTTPGGGVKASLNLDSRAPAIDTTAHDFDPTDTQSYNFSTATSIYDSLGNVHTLTLYAVKTATPGEWTIHSTVDGTNEANSVLSDSTLTFDENGQLKASTPAAAKLGVASASVLLDGVVTDLNTALAAKGKPLLPLNSAVSPQVISIDFTGSTQFGTVSGTNSLQQDGYTSGRLTGVSVSANGIVRGNYSNGQAKDLGQVVLANFTNPNGLASLGGNQWAETSASGTALVGAPNTGTLGVLQSSAVEESNVDLTAELVNMITEQRNYQANAQSIKTQDQIMQTLVNLR